MTPLGIAETQQTGCLQQSSRQAAAQRTSAENCSAADGTLSEVRRIVFECLAGTCLSRLPPNILATLQSGKMLRSRLAMRMLKHTPAPPEHVVVASAAVEMIHAASLLHDDVIDGGEIRRGVPAFWQKFGVSAAILSGDLLFCRAAELLTATEGGLQLLPRFAGKVREMCEAEIEQEIFLREKRLNFNQWLDIARRKTGPLFAFVAGACGGSDRKLTATLEETGYRIGTAYQIADDLLDVTGN